MVESVLFGVNISSPLHLLSLLAYSEKKKFDKIYIHVSVYWLNSRLPARYMEFAIAEYGVNFIDSKYDLSEIVTSNSIVHIASINQLPVSLMVKFINMSLCFKYVILNDGVGYFASFFQYAKIAFREKGVGFFFKYIGSRLLSHVFGYVVKLERFSFFYDNDYSVNMEFKHSFMLVLGKLNMNGSSYKRLSFGNRGVVMLCSQPLVSCGVMSYDEYRALLCDIQSYCNKNDWDLIVKRHPYEDEKNLLGYNLVEYDGTIEELVFSMDNIISVIGFNSTALLLLSAFFEKKTYSISYHGYDARRGLSNAQRKLFDMYVGCITL